MFRRLILRLRHNSHRSRCRRLDSSFSDLAGDLTIFGTSSSSFAGSCARGAFVRYHRAMTVGDDGMGPRMKAMTVERITSHGTNRTYYHNLGSFVQGSCSFPPLFHIGESAKENGRLPSNKPRSIRQVQ